MVETTTRGKKDLIRLKIMKSIRNKIKFNFVNKVNELVPIFFFNVNLE